MGLAVTAHVADGSFERLGEDRTDSVLNRRIEIVYADPA
jgi:hypothetical protein